MKVELLVEHGQAKLLTPIYLKPNSKTKWELDVDDDDIEPSRDWFDEYGHHTRKTLRKPEIEGSAMQKIFNQILQDQAIERPGASIGDDHQLLMEALEERYLGK